MLFREHFIRQAGNLSSLPFPSFLLLGGFKMDFRFLVLRAGETFVLLLLANRFPTGNFNALDFLDFVFGCGII